MKETATLAFCMMLKLTKTDQHSCERDGNAGVLYDAETDKDRPTQPFCIMLKLTMKEMTTLPFFMILKRTKTGDYSRLTLLF